MTTATRPSSAAKNNNNSYTIKLAFLSFFFLILLFLLLRPSSSDNHHQLLKPQPQAHEQQQCSAVPTSVSQALIHYATSNITPQQTMSEISVTDRVLRRKSPCNFLIFGLGHDSLMWSSLNHAGHTLFLEEDATWIKEITSKFPDLVSLHVSYDTKVRHAEELLRTAAGSDACNKVVDPRDSDCPLALKRLPQEVYEVEWDVIMVDAPTGYHDEAPGRMSAIYTAGLLARNRRSDGETDVMVHDVNRPVEDRFSMAFLCEGYMRQQEGRLRHFALPSHKSDTTRSSFCP